MSDKLDEGLKLDNQLCFPLYAAARKVVGAYTPFLKPLGLTYTQYIVFMVLWENDDLTVGEIGKKLMLDNGTLTPLLKKMEEAGHLTRKRSEKDERVVTVSLTGEGKEMKNKVKGVPVEMKQCIKLDPGEAKTLYKILYKLLD
ncbi:MAG: MarR family transcriptional regulator [Clostridiales bacterium]|nr:MarR family transcriptional regulator [Clostridiales bacterium]MDU1041447.1 MarR family transcriptional regulator [Clostridiales bacterium]MDU3490902.1 MarR family transcriptional regulator [Clostridiales bacterium]